MVQMYLSFMEDVFQKDVVANLKDTVCQATSVVITSHRSPDGDALGSSLALQHLLAAMGVTSHGFAGCMSQIPALDARS